MCKTYISFSLVEVTEVSSAMLKTQQGCFSKLALNCLYIDWFYKLIATLFYDALVAGLDLLADLIN